jgi:uncharacterized repeat protein (TIGR03803 family)
MKMNNPAKTLIGLTAATWIAAWFIGSAQAQTNFQRIVQLGGTNMPNGTRGELIEGSDGYLYGVTYMGVYRMAKDGSGLATLYQFPGHGYGYNGGKLISGLLEASDGNLYGVTEAGPGMGDYCGVIYSIGKNGSNFNVLYRFGINDTNEINVFPNGPLVEATNGALFGTTRYGPSSNGHFLEPFIFTINKDGSGYQRVQDTGGMISGLLFARDGKFYGAGGGGLFVMNQDGSGFSYFYPYAATNLITPTSRPFEGSDGVLYGASYLGGTSNLGLIYKINKDGGGLQILHNFLGSVWNGSNAWIGDGAAPAGGVAEGSDGALYGTANYGGTAMLGILYKINKDGTGYQVFRNFTSTDSFCPDSALLRASDGNLYGSSAVTLEYADIYSDWGGGGFEGGSTIYKLFATPPQVTFTEIQNGLSGMTLNLSGGAAGQNLNIQATTDPSNTNGWQVIGSATAAVDGTFQFTDTNAPNLAARFYRGVSQ